MEHRPYKTWIITESELTKEQWANLQEHLQTCEACRRFQSNWMAVHRQLSAIPLAAPAPGFAHRWRSGLAERRRLQHQLQARRLLLFLVAGATASLLLLFIFLAVTVSPAGLLVNLFEALTRTIVGWNHVEQSILPFVSNLPPIIPIIFWMLLTTGIALLSTVWAITVWRISTQGVRSK